MDSEKAQKRQENPSDGVVDRAGLIAEIGASVHRGDQEQIDQPADEAEAAGEKPDGTGDGAPVIEAMGTGEAENP